VLRLLGFERRWLVRVFEHLLPSGADARLVLGAADVPMERFVDDLLSHASLEFIVGLRFCLWMLMLAPVVVLFLPRTFLGLPPDERSAVLERLRTSDRYLVREAPLLLKTLACLAYGGLPEVQRALDIAPVDAVPPSWAKVPAAKRPFGANMDGAA